MALLDQMALLNGNAGLHMTVDLADVLGIHGGPRLVDALQGIGGGVGEGIMQGPRRPRWPCGSRSRAPDPVVQRRQVWVRQVRRRPSSDGDNTSDGRR